MFGYIYIARCLEVRLWLSKNVRVCASPCGSLWLICRVYLLICWLVGWLYSVLFQKWLRAALGNGSDELWESMGRSSVSLAPRRGYIASDVGAIAAHFPCGCSWDFLWVFHKSSASTISRATWDDFIMRVFLIMRKSIARREREELKALE